MPDLVPVPQLAVQLVDVPPQRSVAAGVWLTILFGPLGCFYAGGKYGFAVLGICIGAALLTLGLSILVQVFVLPFVMAGRVRSQNARRAALLGA